jgi:hypothetical protein
MDMADCQKLADFSCVEKSVGIRAESLWLVHVIDPNAKHQP